MKKADIKVYREKLLALRARLQGDITQMADGALNKDLAETKSMPTDMADVGSDNFERELTLNLMGGEKGLLD